MTYNKREWLKTKFNLKTEEEIDANIRAYEFNSYERIKKEKKEKNKIKTRCDCGGIYCHGTEKPHYKSIKHKKYILKIAIQNHFN